MKFILTLLFFFLVGTLWAQDYYRSNSLGFPLENIGWYRQAETEWVLRRDKGNTALSDVITLSRWGKVVEIRQRELYSEKKIKSILIIRDGKLDSRLFYDVAGNIIQETLFNKGQVTYHLQYIYIGNFLRQVLWLNPEKVKLFSDTYYRDSRGRLRRIDREFPDGKNQLSQWVYGKDVESQEWSISGSVTNRFSYNLDGKDLKQQLWDNGNLMEQRLWEYKGMDLISQTEQKLSTKEEKTVFYNEKKQIIKEVQGKKGDFKSEESFNYDEKGRLSERLQFQPNLKDRYVYSWDDRDRLTSETFYRNSEIQTIRHFIDGELNKQEVFYAGVKVLEAQFLKGEKSKEIFFNSAGGVIRERIIIEGMP